MPEPPGAPGDGDVLEVAACFRSHEEYWLGIEEPPIQRQAPFPCAKISTSGSIQSHPCPGILTRGPLQIQSPERLFLVVVVASCSLAAYRSLTAFPRPLHVSFLSLLPNLTLDLLQDDGF